MNATMSESSPTFLLIFYAFYFLFLGSMVLSALIPSIVAYFIEAFALYKLARKLGRKYAWLAWIPLCGVYFRVYVLADLADEKPVKLLPGKLVIDKRLTSFWIYLGISLLGAYVISTVTSFLGFIPIVGMALSIILTALPVVVCAYFHYVYLKDALDIFSEDKESNTAIAVMITLLDSLGTQGLARAIYLLMLTRRDPLPASDETF